MKRTYRFVEPSGVVTCVLEGGEPISVPIFAGILKHPSVDQLARLLTDPIVVRKYTHEALRKGPWNALRRFPRGWLIACLPGAGLTDGRRHALELLLGSAAQPPPDQDQA